MTQNLFEHTDEFDTDIDVLIDGAYAENLAAGRVVTEDFANQLATNALESRLDTMLEDLEASHNRLNIHEIKNDETRRDFVRAFANAKATFEEGDFKLPTPAEFHNLASVDFGRLASIYEDMQTWNLNPQIVIAPHMQPMSFWRTTMERARNHSADKHPDRVRGNALHIWDDALNFWDSLKELPTDTPNFKNWTIRLIPEAAATPDTSDFDRHNYPTVSEYLSMQAVRFYFDRPPLHGVRGGLAPKTILDGGSRLELGSVSAFGRAGTVSRQIELAIADEGWLESENSRHHKPEW